MRTREQKINIENKRKQLRARERTQRKIFSFVPLFFSLQHSFQNYRLHMFARVFGWMILESLRQPAARSVGDNVSTSQKYILTYINKNVCVCTMMKFDVVDGTVDGIAVLP